MYINTLQPPQDVFTLLQVAVLHAYVGDSVGDGVGDSVGDDVVGDGVGEDVGDSVGDDVVGDGVGEDVVGDCVGDCVAAAPLQVQMRSEPEPKFLPSVLQDIWAVSPACMLVQELPVSSSTLTQFPAP